MRGSTALLRAATAVAMSAALMLPFNTGAAAIGTTGLDLNKLRPELRNHVSGMVDQAISSRSSSGSSAILVNFFPRQDECNITRAGNVKVNQNCLNITDADLQGRGQAQNETTVAVDPNNPRHIVTGFNDYRRGDGTCGTAYSLDGGKTFNESTMPNGFPLMPPYSFTTIPEEPLLDVQRHL